MDDVVKVLSVIEGVIQVLDDECGAEERPRLKAAIAALERVAEILGDMPDGL